jgi:hypothetical protein
MDPVGAVLSVAGGADVIGRSALPALHANVLASCSVFDAIGLDQHSRS